MKTNVVMIYNQRANAIVVALGMISAVILLFWLMPQFGYNTIYLYFRGLGHSSVDKVTVVKDDRSENFKSPLRLDSSISYAPIWGVDAIESKNQCSRSQFLRQTLELNLNRFRYEPKDKLSIWGIKSKQSDYFDKLINLTGLNFYCQAENNKNPIVEAKLLIQMARHLVLLRDQQDYDQLHISLSSFLTNPARTQLYALSRIKNFEIIKQDDPEVLKHWRDWLNQEKNALRKFLSGFNSDWVPGDLYKLNISRQDRWLGLWDEIKLKELLQGLSFRRDLYGSLFNHTLKLVEQNEFNPNKIKLIEQEIKSQLNEKFNLTLNTSPMQRFLDFLIAPRGFDRRVLHNCFRDFSIDFDNGVLSGIRWQLRLIARIEYAIESIE